MVAIVGNKRALQIVVALSTVGMDWNKSVETLTGSYLQIRYII